MQNLSSVCLFIFQSEEDISVEQAQSHHLAQLLALQLPSRANLFLNSIEVMSVLYIILSACLFALVAIFDAQCM